jgi:predicted lipoprotein with Yx(FWY)xxD motif
MRPKTLMVAATVGAAGFAAACTSPVTAPPAASPAAFVPSAASVAPPGSGPVVRTATVGTQGTLLVAGADGMTVYTFSKDVANGGTSACAGGCITRWPALTIPAGSTPAGGSGVTGRLGTITRADDSSTQATYNGLPLYFFSGDTAPRDANGVYSGWSAVKP